MSDVEHSVEFYLALKRAKLDVELHIYSTGGHGFGVKQDSPCASWTKNCENWMRKNGILKK